MRVIHITSMDSGGAALEMLNLHHALLDAGVDSNILVAFKSTSDDTIF